MWVDGLIYVQTEGGLPNGQCNSSCITARREHVTIYHAGRREDVTVSSLQTRQLHGIVNMAQPVEKYPEMPSKCSTPTVGCYCQY